MSLSGTIGSPIAKSLALAANPELLVAGAVIGGVAVTVGAGILIYKKVEELKEKKHQETIALLNKIHATHLQVIHVLTMQETVGLPPFFQKDKDDPTQLHTIYVSDEDLMKYGQERAPGDATLLPYFRHIKSAIKKIRYYYFLRIKEHKSNRDDPLSKVLLYLLYTLEKFCTKFEGYNLDIAYMKAISACLNDISLRRQTTQSQIHSHLEKAMIQLDEGIRVLEWHNHELSMQEAVDDLNDACIKHCEKLMPLLTSFIIEKKHRDEQIISSTIFEEYALGIIREEHIKVALLGNDLLNEHQISIPGSDFSNWIKQLSIYFLKVEDTRIILSQKDMPDTDALFKMPILTMNDEHYKELRKIFENSRSVMFSKSVAVKNKVNKYKTECVTSVNDIQQRMNIMADAFLLFNLLSTVVYLSVHILKAIKNLGILYMEGRTDEPYQNIFYVLHNFRQLLVSCVTKNKANLDIINKANQGDKTEDQELLSDLSNFLTSIDQEINPKFDDIKRLRDDAQSNPRLIQKKIEEAEQEMETVAVTIAKSYKMILPKNPVAVAAVAAPPVITEKLEETPRKDLLKHLLLCQDQLKDIAVDQKLNRNQLAAYQLLKNALSILEQKSQALLSENTDDLHRHQKIDNVLAVYFEWTLSISAFLYKNKEARSHDFKAFIDERIKSLSEVNAIIDQHDSRLKQYTNDTLHLRLFNTQSRAVLETVCHALEKLPEGP